MPLNVTVTITAAGRPFSGAGDKVVVEVTGADIHDTAVIRQTVERAIEAWRAAHGPVVEHAEQGQLDAALEEQELAAKADLPEPVRDVGIPLPRTEEGGELQEAGF